MYQILNVQDTIAAVATPSGGGCRGIVRVSGPDTVELIRFLFRGLDGESLPLRGARMAPGHFALPSPWREVPCHLYLWPTARSYTRQPSAEIHTFGAAPLLDAVLAAICQAGARIAQPGEFTLRAFLAGRLDLTQAEGVLGVIDARGGTDFQDALDQLAGGLSAPLRQIRTQLLETLAHLEAGLDFVEERIEFIAREALMSQIQAAIVQMDALKTRLVHRAEMERDSRVTFVGYPNVGKSSLFNALVGHHAAIVSTIAGATRDFLTCDVDIDGLTVTLIDTAGLGAAVDPSLSGAAAQNASRKQQEHTELQLLCLDATRPLNHWELDQLKQPAQRMIVWTKIDQCGDDSNRPMLGLVADSDTQVRTSSRTGAGLHELRAAIRRRLAGDTGEAGGSASVTARCRESLQLSSESLRGAWQVASDDAGEELVAAELRVALEELAKIVGAIYTDDILDRIFSRFCIGK